MRRSRMQRGFGLLEAIVALALFAAAGMALFAWINTSIAQAARLERSEAETRLRGIASEWVIALDIAARPEGNAELAEGLRIRWQARPLTPRTPVAPFPGGTVAIMTVALFAVDVFASEAASGAELEFTQNRIAVWRLQAEQELIPL